MECILSGKNKSPIMEAKATRTRNRINGAQSGIYKINMGILYVCYWNGTELINIRIKSTSDFVGNYIKLRLKVYFFRTYVVLILNNILGIFLAGQFLFFIFFKL